MKNSFSSMKVFSGELFKYRITQTQLFQRISLIPPIKNFKMADIKVELEEYMKKNNVQDFLNNIVLKIVEHKPANPLFYLHIQKSHFKKASSL